MNEKLQALETEMAYTSWDNSCQDPHVTWTGDMRQCRREKGHDGAHASGFVSSGNLYLWTDCGCTEEAIVKGCRTHYTPQPSLPGGQK